MTEDWMRLWPPGWPSLAPRELTQSGWTFGNLVVNTGNSSAPDTEAAIVSKDSYGRQIGKLLDAVAVLVELQPNKADEPAFSDLLKLRDRIEDAKAEAATRRVDQFRRDLALLRTANPELHREIVADLRKSVDEGSS